MNATAEAGAEGKRRERGDVFTAYLEQLMEERGIDGIEGLHERFLETGWHIPVPGRHTDKPVKLEEFKRHAALTYPTPESPWLYTQFYRGVEEVLEREKALTDKEHHELFWRYVSGEELPEELRGRPWPPNPTE